MAAGTLLIKRRFGVKIWRKKFQKENPWRRTYAEYRLRVKDATKRMPWSHIYVIFDKFYLPAGAKTSTPYVPTQKNSLMETLKG